MDASYATDPGLPSTVRIVVIGDRGTGKSSLIIAAAIETFTENVPPILPPTLLPSDIFPDRVSITIIDTAASPEHRGNLVAECKMTDAVVLTYACDRIETLERLSKYWLPELRRMEVKVPVIVAGCKLDLREEKKFNLDIEVVISAIMQQFREIETCIECSALKLTKVVDVFYFAQRAVLYPTAPLFDQETRSLKSRCLRALKRIFILCDHDKDGALSDTELSGFQVRCFNCPLQHSEISAVKKVVQESIDSGVNDLGLTLKGFLFLHSHFMDEGQVETTWTVLRKFGYDNDVKLRDDLFLDTINRAPDQTVELTDVAVEFLKEAFFSFDADKDGVLQTCELEDLFSTAPESPWIEDPYKDAAQQNKLEGFLSGWAFMTLLDPPRGLANLLYIGYTGDIASAFRITRRRQLDRKRKVSQRNVFQCYIFGPENSGKSTLLSSFSGSPFSGKNEAATCDCFATNVVGLLGGAKKTLVLREICEGGVEGLLCDKQSLAACDVALFVYDSSDADSWEKAKSLLFQVASHGVSTGFEVPCLVVQAKADLDPSIVSVQDSKKVCQDMGIEAPISVSMKLGDCNNIFYRIVDAARHPHLSIPVTESGKNHRRYRRHVRDSLIFVSVGAAVAIAGLAAYKMYTRKKCT